MEYVAIQADVVLPPKAILLSQAMRHVFAVRLTNMSPTPPSRLGGLSILYLVLVIMYEGKVRNADGTSFRLHEGIVDVAYGEFGGGGDGRWHTDALRWAKEWPKKKFQRRHLLRIKLWYIFFEIIGMPLDIASHRCSVCEGCM